MWDVKENIKRAPLNKTNVKYTTTEEKPDEEKKYVVIRVPMDISHSLKDYANDYELKHKTRLYNNFVFNVVYDIVISNFEKGVYLKSYDRFIYNPKKAKKIETRKSVFPVPLLKTNTLNKLKAKTEKESNSKYLLSINQIFNFELKKYIEKNKNEL
tara:strand:+ start:7747 stop:8214 length:468 start_codon:yes stop_codon:yes gene_type:complete